MALNKDYAYKAAAKAVSPRKEDCPKTLEEFSRQWQKAVKKTTSPQPAIAN